MFQSSSNAQQRALVNLTFADGKKAMVSIKLSITGKLNETLNNADQFLDVISGSGEAFMIAKSHVIKIEIADPPHAKLNQQRRATDKSHFNPWAVLGIENTATKDQIHSAYIKLVKTYHPDKFANYELPPEMKDYASAMLARVNMAYDQVGS
jgi:DnaJ-domain-containing protein 1